MAREHEGERESECEVGDCSRAAAVRLHDPRGPNRLVCAAHARAMVQSEGVVAEPLEGSESEFP
jgi:hypothetical protein